MSNWLGVEHQPAKLLWGNVQVPLGEQLSSNGNLRIKKTKEYPKKVSHRFPEGSFWKGNRNEWWDGKWKLWFQTSNICIYIIYIYILCILCICFNIQSQSMYPVMGFPPKEKQPVQLIGGLCSQQVFVECSGELWQLVLDVVHLLLFFFLAVAPWRLLQCIYFAGQPSEASWGLEIGRFVWSLEMLLAWAKVENPLCK